MSSVYWPLPVMNLKSSLRRTAAPIPVALMAFPPSGCDWMFSEATSSGSLSHCFRAGRDRLDDVVISSAAADVALELFADRLVVERVALALHHVDRRHDHAGGTEAALQAVIVAERLLHRVQRRAIGEPIDGKDVRAFGLPGEHGTGFDRLAVHVDDASTALRGVAADVGTGEAQCLA